MRRSVLILIGGTLLAAGVTIALVPFSTNITFVDAAGGTVHGTSDCGTPVRAAFRSSPQPSAWFAYAPGTKVIASDGFGCQDPARRRIGVGVLLAILGCVALAFAVRVQRRGAAEATVS